MKSVSDEKNYFTQEKIIKHPSPKNMLQLAQIQNEFWYFRSRSFTYNLVSNILYSSQKFLIIFFLFFFVTFSFIYPCSQNHTPRNQPKKTIQHFNFLLYNLIRWNQMWRISVEQLFLKLIIVYSFRLKNTAHIWLSKIKS